MIAIVFGGVLDKQSSNMTKYSLNALCEIFGDDNVLFIDFYRGNKLQKICGEQHRYVKTNFDDWVDYADGYRKMVKLLEDNNIDKVIWYRQGLSANYRSDNYGIAKSFEKQIANKDYKLSSYMSTRAIHCKYILMKAMSRYCDVVTQFLIDIQEFVFDTTMKFKGKFYKIYLAQVKGFIFMPTFELGLSLYHKPNIKKDNDFVFWCTAKTNDRAYLAERKSELESLGYDIQIVCRNETTAISEEEYDNKLAHSLFTLAVPAYATEHFSIWRIIEALANDCLCLILSLCNLNDLQKTFPDIYQIVIDDGLIIKDFSDIKDKIADLKPKHNEIIKKLKSTGSYLKITNLDYCRRRWFKMLEV